jgi:hypothetical protein
MLAHFKGKTKREEGQWTTSRERRSLSYLIFHSPDIPCRWTGPLRDLVQPVCGMKKGPPFERPPQPSHPEIKIFERYYWPWSCGTVHVLVALTVFPAASVATVLIV